MLDCEFLQYSFLGDDGTVGIFKFRLARQTSCVSLKSDSALGPFLATARVAAVLSTIFAFGGMLLVIIEFTCCRVCCSRVLEIFMYIFAEIFGGLTFVLWGNDYCTVSGKCTMGKGAWLMVIAVIAYFLAGLFVCFAPKPKPILRRKREKNAAEMQHDTEEAHEQGEANDKLDAAQPYG